MPEVCEHLTAYSDRMLGRKSNEKPQSVRPGLKSKEDHSNYRGRAFFRRSGLAFFRIGRFDPSAAGPSKPRTRVLFATSAASATAARSYERSAPAYGAPLSLPGKSFAVLRG